MAQTICSQIIVAITLMCATSLSVTASPDEISALLNFKSFLSNDAAINNWNVSVEPCDPDGSSKWIGVLCDNATVQGLKLEAMGLGGVIDMESLAKLPALRSISFMNNSFHGSFPELGKLRNVRAVYLSNNDYSGEISGDAFKGMKYLKKVYVGGNDFAGKIPESLAALPRLVGMDLEGNLFSGKIPNFGKRRWSVMDLANNRLEGSIPKGLSDLDPAVFAGNKDLCGRPLKACKKKLGSLF